MTAAARELVSLIACERRLRRTGLGQLRRASVVPRKLTSSQAIKPSVPTMPIVPFDSLPDSSRIWIFGSDRPVTGPAAEQLLAEVDRFLDGWRAHGEPLRCGRLWADDRFLVVGVDQSDANA